MEEDSRAPRSSTSGRSEHVPSELRILPSEEPEGRGERFFGRRRTPSFSPGGHSLLPAMKLRVSSPAAVIDIGRVKGLQGIKAGKSSVKIGALTTHAEVAESGAVAKSCPLLSEAAAQIGDMQVQEPRHHRRKPGARGSGRRLPDGHRGTRCRDYRDRPQGLAADSGAEVLHRSLHHQPQRLRRFVTEVSVPVAKKGEGAVYLKHRHPASSYVVVGVAAIVTLKNDQIKSARLVVGGVTANPLVIGKAQDFLAGQKPSPKLFAEAAALVAEAIDSPLGGSLRFRRVPDPSRHGDDPARPSGGGGSREEAEVACLIQSIEQLQSLLREKLYVADRGLATSIYLALKLERPLFVEGEAGVGKTEIAKVLASILSTRSSSGSSATKASTRARRSTSGATPVR